MTNEPTASKARKDKLAKWIFLGVVGVAAILVWRVQREPDVLKDWERDLPKALADGKAQYRPVLIFFHDIPMNETCLNVIKPFGMGPSMTAYEKYKYIRVRVGTSVSAEVARQWRIESFPTLVIVGPSGKEAGRYVGFIAATEYYERFLPLGKGDSDDAAPPQPRP